MRKLAIVAALASTAIAGPALARDKAWYLGLNAGAMIVEDIDYDIGATNNAVTIDSRYGYDVGGMVGYDLGMLRVEAEVAYKSADVDEARTSVALPAGGAVNSPAGRYTGAVGKTSALSFMGNALLDFGEDDGVQGFVGGGAGIARVKADNLRLAGGLPTFNDDSDTRFAYQGIAGIRAPLTPNIDASIKYRFFNVDNVRTIASTGAQTESRFRSHSILGGVTFNFGAPTPPPPTPAPTPAPPPEPTPEPVVVAPTPPPTPGPFIVFFDWNKSEITPEAAAILDNAASAYQQFGQATVTLAGHADKSGSDQYNVGLSQRRADAVRSYLSGKGIPDSALQTEAFGESRPLVETADGVREPQNRRVEINFAGGAAPAQ